MVTISGPLYQFKPVSGTGAELPLFAADTDASALADSPWACTGVLIAANKQINIAMRRIRFMIPPAAERLKRKAS
jgi:hypothetical protein